MIIEQMRRHMDIIFSQAKRHEVLAKCNVGDKVFINDSKAVCVHKTSVGSYRFKTLEEPIKVYTYDRGEMKKAKWAYEVLVKVDDVLEEHLYS